MNIETGAEKLDFDALRQQIPAWFYKRFDLTGKAGDYFLFTIDIGFTYLLRSIRTKWPLDGNRDPATRQEILIKFVGTLAERTYQNVEYPARLISTPAEAGKAFRAGTARREQNVQAVTMLNAVDQDAFGINMTATPVKNNLILNYFYQRRDTLNMPLRFEVANTGQFNTGFVDILFIGYYMPDKDLAEWG